MTPKDAVRLLLSPTGKSALLLAAGVLALAASAFVVVRGEIAESGVRAAEFLAKDARTLRNEARELAARKKAAEEAAPLTSVPAFIDRIGDLADRNQAVVGSVKPAAEGGALFEMQVAATYRELLNFVAALEELDVEVTGFEIARAALGPGKPRLEATVHIRPRNNARRLAIPRLEAVRAALGETATRDPFQALVADDAGAGADRLDLTQAYNLTGIAVIEPAGERIATIDLFDYVTGDVLDGREIVQVGEDRVLLDTLGDPEGEKYVIRFRHTDEDPEFGGSLRSSPRTDVPEEPRPIQ